MLHGYKENYIQRVWQFQNIYSRYLFSNCLGSTVNLIQNFLFFLSDRISTCLGWLVAEFVFLFILVIQ